MESKVIVICGPTCSGKTELSLMLAEVLNSEIISADSRQIYKQLSVGTAKPSAKELLRVKHHLVDFLNPEEEYNASKFEKDAIEIIFNLLQKDITPIVAGGSGLYLKALVEGIFDSVDTDEKFRIKIMREREQFGNEFLLEKLKNVDPKTASALLPQNWKRIIRALEVFHITGEPIWKHQEKHTRELNIDFVQFGINWKREILYKNIELRVDEMVNQGLVEEVKSILLSGYDQNLNSLNTVGYKEVIQFLENEITLERAIELIKRNTRRYAKRQMTWFRSNDKIKWFDIADKSDLARVTQQIIETLN